MDLPKAKLAMIYALLPNPPTTNPGTPTRYPVSVFVGYLQHLSVLGHLGHGSEAGAHAAHNACLAIALRRTVHPLPTGGVGQQAGQTGQAQRQARQPRAAHVVDKSTQHKKAADNRQKHQNNLRTQAAATINNLEGNRKCPS